ncbi:MAG TPA: hypothetical protein VGC14_21930 [Rhizobium sp.]
MGDDIPYILNAPNGTLVEIPSHCGIDDWPQFVQSMNLNYMMPIRAPLQGFEVFRQEFETAYRYGGLWVPVVHPFVSGRLSRWTVFASFLEEVLSRGDVWFAPVEDIARHVRAVSTNNPGAVRSVNVPPYTSPVRAHPLAV